MECEEERLLVETLDRLRSLSEQLQGLREDLEEILNAQAALLACLKEYAPQYFQADERRPDVLGELEALGEDLGAGYEVSDCGSARRALLEASSRASALSFLMAEALHQLRVEAVRLAGLVALCRHFEPQLSERVYEEVLDRALRNYVGV